MEFSEVFDARFKFPDKNLIETNGVKNKTPYTFIISDGGFKSLPNKGRFACGYATMKEAEDAREKAIKEYDTSYEIIVLKNSDFTEGRGPMVEHQTFKSASDAHDYIMSNRGISGCQQKLSISVGITDDGNMYGYFAYNGYEIKIVTER